MFGRLRRSAGILPAKTLVMIDGSCRLTLSTLLDWYTLNSAIVGAGFPFKLTSFHLKLDQPAPQ